jgi:hypothetical protein
MQINSNRFLQALFALLLPFCCMAATHDSEYRELCGMPFYIRGRNGFDGESEAWAAGSSGGPALKSSKTITDNNNYQLIAA